MKILFVHQNFPGQFKHLAPALRQSGHEVTALVPGDRNTPAWNGIAQIPYSLDRGNAKDAHPWTVDFESKVIRGHACSKGCDCFEGTELRARSIVAHPGWEKVCF